MKIAFAPICACKNNRRIWRQDAGITRSRDVTDQLWWRHNAKSEKTVLDNDCDMSDWWLFSKKLCVKDIKLCVRNKIIHSLPWITIFGSLVMRFTNDFHSWLRHSWKSLANRLTRDPKIVIHGNSCIILYIFGAWCSIWLIVRSSAHVHLPSGLQPIISMTISQWCIGLLPFTNILALLLNNFINHEVPRGIVYQFQKKKQACSLFYQQGLVIPTPRSGHRQVFTST